MTADEIEALCEVMHDAYEAAAVDADWQTQESSRKPWADVPEANRATMRVAMAAVAARLREQVAEEIEAQAPTAEGFGKDTYGRNLALLLREHWASAARIARGQTTKETR